MTTRSLITRATAFALSATLSWCAADVAHAQDTPPEKTPPAAPTAPTAPTAPDQTTSEGQEPPPAPATPTTPDQTPSNTQTPNTQTPQPAPATSTAAPEVDPKQATIDFQRERILRLTNEIREKTTALVGKREQATSANLEAIVQEERDLAVAKGQRAAVEASLAALQGAQLDATVAENALEHERDELARARRALELAKEKATSENLALRIEFLETSIETLERAARAANSSKPTDKRLEELEFERGGRLKFGPTISLLRFSVARDPDEPARYRNYEPRLHFVPSEVGFQFVFQPHNGPWRIKRKKGEPFQLMSAGGMLLASVDKNDVRRGSISLAATLSFFQELVGLGVGVDLYRGIEVADVDGTPGGDTAYTGLLAWSLSPRGEVTPENVFFVVTLGLVPLVNSITGELK